MHSKLKNNKSLKNNKNLKILKNRKDLKILKSKKLLINLLFVIILCLIIFIIYSKFFSNSFKIRPFGIQALTVSSNSMMPVFQKGDIIIIKEEVEYNVGDIVTFKDNSGNLVTHRIIEKCENVFYTKGDNNNTKDEEKINNFQIIGKVVYLICLHKGHQ